MKGKTGRFFGGQYPIAQPYGVQPTGMLTRIQTIAKSNTPLIVVGSLFAIVIVITAIVYAVRENKIKALWKDNIYIRDGLIIGDKRDKASPLGNMILVDNPEAYIGQRRITFFTYIHVNHIGQNIAQNRNIFVMPFKGFPLDNSTSANTIATGNLNVDYSNNGFYPYTFENEKKKDTFKPDYTTQLNANRKEMIYVGLPDTINPYSSGGLNQNNYFMRAYLKKYTNDIVIELKTSINTPNMQANQMIIRNIPIHTWFSIAVVFDEDAVIVYLDGAHYLSRTITVPANFGTVGEPIYLGQGLLPADDTVMTKTMPGCKDDARFYPFNGVMASFVVVNQALYAEMIRNLHDTSLTDTARTRAKNIEEPVCDALADEKVQTAATK